MSVATASKAVINETLEHCDKVIEVEQLLESCRVDGIPLPYHQAKTISELSQYCVSRGGFYIWLNRQEAKGTIVTFFDSQGDVIRSVSINKPDVSKDRKIPKLNWLKQLFANIGYKADRIEIKYIHRMVESHIRDGGSWTTTLNDNQIHFVLYFNGQVKARYEFHKEAEQ